MIKENKKITLAIENLPFLKDLTSILISDILT